ncbi:DEAD/DEAH box helicase [Amycolatopsis anabasis]|uniref:DEAD/DEAH box helicase n=1 Tax=Amycolatopsis anabasis TaxID=1840409 RepID=UPI001FE9CB00|nr:DEAD/DEAH box helicase [Amycolatopsis anabasis]
MLLAAKSGAARALEFWGAAAAVALELVARGRLLPGVSPGDFDAWRAGPLEVADIERLRELAAAMPPECRAIPLPGAGEPRLPESYPLLRAFVDAVADGVVRSSARGTPFAGVEPRWVPELREWSESVAYGRDAGMRLTLRLEVPDADFESASFRAVVRVHSLADPTVHVDAGELWANGEHRLGEQARRDTVLAVRQAAQTWPPLERLLDAAVPDALVLADDEVGDLLAGDARRLADAGVTVSWPDGLGHGLGATAVARSPEPWPADVEGFFRTAPPLPVEWQLLLDGEPLTTAETDLVAKAPRPLARLRGRWVLIAPELAIKAQEREIGALRPFDALAAVLIGSTEFHGRTTGIVADGWLGALHHRIAEPAAGAEPLRQPDGLRATLRDYQLQGLRWLDRMTALGFGGCLADDMGLGKTIMLIALHLCRGSGPTLVLCPASLLGNWEREIRRFAPGTPVRRFHGPGRTLDGVGDGFVLTTYGTMRLDADRLAAVPWDLIAADEAQHVKNRLSGTAKALRTIPAAARVALTGTPVENNLSELWTILDWTTPGLLGRIGAFRARWAAPVESGQDTETARRLARLVKPFLLRRRKTDPGIAPELPPKTETDHPVALTEEQVTLYETVVRDTLAEIRGSRDLARRGLIIKLLTALKQICNHPAHFRKQPQGVLPGRSGKLELLDELLDTILAEGGAVLVFTQYVTMARLLERHLRDRGIGAQLLHGGTPVAQREEQVRLFQEGRVPVFLLSLKAAGTGLNLTRADHVVHYDRWWNPAVEEQATDRAHRIGQTRPVQVHRLIAEGTLEDRIAALLESKRELADAVLSGGEAAFTELTDAELAELVTLRRTP